MPTIGIDLGTTFSAAAVPGECHGDRFTPCGAASVLRDEHERLTVPSVVAAGPDGEPVVGYRAKARAGMTPGPIMFAKRAMGTDRTFPFGGREVHPEQVSAFILSHIRKAASEALGEPVERAVITVPAWFSLMAKTQTRSAGELAGLEVSLTAPEPVAASLAYFGQPGMDDDGPETILTYDLGGGTFDAAVVSRVTGVPEVLSSRGDPHLGGYEFDKRLALHIAERLRKQNYELEIDPDDENDPVLARLMVLAERAKIELSSKPVAVLCLPDSGLTDARGVPVTIDMEIARATFNEMIDELVARTIQLTRQALEPEGGTAIAPEQIDAIIMVGGSSRMPLVSQALEEEFGIKPVLMNPDLCVAIGAAILADAQPEITQWSKLDRPAEETDQSTVQVTGEVLDGGSGATVSGWRIHLERADGEYAEEQRSGDSGAFAFEHVQLRQGEDNDFTLTGFDRSDAERFSHQFTVRQTDTPRAVGVTFVPETNRLSMPLVVETSEGPYVVAAAGEALPFVAELTGETTESGTMRIPVNEGENRLGECLVENIPPEVGVGSLVRLRVEISSTYEVHLRAELPALAKTAEMPPARLVPPRRKTVDELRAELSKMRGQVKDVVSSAEPGELFEEGRGERIERLLEGISEELDSGHPDRDRAQQLTGELNYLLNEMTTVWQPQPSRRDYEEVVGDVERLLVEAATADETVSESGWDARFEALRDAAEEAFADRDEMAWRHAVDELKKLGAQLKEIVDGPGRERTPGEWILIFGEHLSSLRPAAEEHGFEGALEECMERLRSIKADDPRVMEQLAALQMDDINPLEQKLRAAGAIDDSYESGRIRIIDVL